MTVPLAAQLQDALGASYRIEQELDGGGMSRLYVATELTLNRRVVIKVLPPDLTTETSVARFKREIDVTVKLQHPNILPVLTAGSWDDLLYYVSPYIAGESLRARIQREGKLPLDDVVRILREAGDALAYAHSRGVVHRDVKPANILLHDGHAILADFGIAMALSSSGGSGSLTGSGMRPGTPAYMAPDLPSDQSADVYSLGVVGYEMLAGVLPPRRVTAKQIIAARGKVAGDSRLALRHLATVLAKSLEMSAERRTATTSEFTTALVALPTSTSVPRWPIAIAAALAVAAGVWMWARSGTTARVVDRNPYVVAPFRGADAALAAVVTRRVSDALGEWDGVRVLDDQRASDAFAGTRAASSVESLTKAARDLGAHTLVTGDVDRRGDSVFVRVMPYAVSDTAHLPSATVAYAARIDTSAKTAVRRLANTIFRGAAALPWASAADSRRPVLASWKAYDRGRDALARWDLAAAERAFREAIAIDSRNASAQMWLAQTLLWLDKDIGGDFRSAARQAQSARETLDEHDSRLTAAIWAIADSQYIEACRRYRELLGKDSTDLAAWTGLADCQWRDRTVVPNTQSASGWVFRGSFAAAARAYLHAGEIAPPSVDPAFHGWLLGRLGNVLYTETNHLRSGRAQGTREPLYGATFLSGDSIAFAPRPLRDIASGKNVRADLADAAIARNLETLRHTAEQWVFRDQNNPTAHTALAMLAEATGGVATVGELRVTAIEEIQKAQLKTPAADSAGRLRLAIIETRFRVKAEQFDTARKLADSLLALAAARPHGPVELASLALLVGRPSLAARLLEQNSTDSIVAGGSGFVRVPPQVMREHLRLVAYAAQPGLTDSVHAIAQRADAAVRNFVTGQSLLAEVRTGVLSSALSLVFPDESQLLASIRTNDRMVRLQQLTLNDRGAATRALREMMRQSNAHAAAQAMDGPYRMAMAALRLGDSASAVAILDRALGSLSTAGERLFLEPTQVGGLTRAIILRAEIAASRNDRKTAAHWANAIVVLWRNAEPELQPVVARMKALASKS